MPTRPNAFTILNIEGITNGSTGYDGQAVPDATDWMIVSLTDSGSGVAHAASVGPLPAPTATGVAVQGGSIWYNGASVAFAAASPVVAAISTTDRRDLVCASVNPTSTTAVPVVVAGTACNVANWTRTAASLPPVKPALPSTNVALAEIYLVGSTSSASTSAINAINLVDKRAFLSISDAQVNSVYTAPGQISVGTGSGTGELLALGASGYLLTVVSGEPAWGFGPSYGQDIGYNMALGQIPASISPSTESAGTGAYYNTAYGWEALESLTTGHHNVAIGTGALMANTTGLRNTAIGEGSLFSNVGGTNNVAIGTDALEAGTAVANCVAIGDSALYFNTSSNMTAIGFNALKANVSGTQCTAIGVDALEACTGNNNTAIGYLAGYQIVGGADNVAVGSEALLSCVFGTANMAVGYQALQACTGSYDTGIGYASLGACTSGSENVAIGAETLSGIVAGHYNTANGYLAGSQSTDVSYTTCLGANTSATANGAVAIGIDSGANGASSATTNLIVLGTSAHTTRIPGIPAFVTGDLYLVVDSNGDIHKSSLGPIS